MDGEVGEGECSGRTREAKDDLRIHRGRGEADLTKEPFQSQPFVQRGKYLPIWLIAAHSSASAESFEKTLVSPCSDQVNTQPRPVHFGQPRWREMPVCLRSYHGMS